LLVVIGIISILSSMMFSALQRSRQSAWAVSCMNNLRQLGLATQLYTDFNDEFLPYPNASFGGSDQHPELCWFNALDPYITGQQAAIDKLSEKLNLVKQDPVIKQFAANWFTNAHTVKMNQRLGENAEGDSCFYRLGAIKDAARTVLLFDGRAETEKLASGSPAAMARNPQGTEGYVSRRHSDRANVLFLDGHVELRNERHQANGGLGWELDKTRLIWKPWTE
jgi:prepilin-type processing-associated H-X9-DG protein